MCFTQLAFEDWSSAHIIYIWSIKWTNVEHYQKENLKSLVWLEMSPETVYLDKYSDIVVHRLIMRADDLALRSIHYVYNTYNNLMILTLVKSNSCKKCVHSTLWFYFERQ